MEVWAKDTFSLVAIGRCTPWYMTKWYMTKLTCSFTHPDVCHSEECNEGRRSCLLYEEADSCTKGPIAGLTHEIVMKETGASNPAR